MSSTSKEALPRAVRTIRVAGAVGAGPTELAAFDAALRDIGVANFNLIRLSSVIPPAMVVSPGDGHLDVHGSWGDRLYVVYAEQRTSNPGEEVWAGIGWVQNSCTGRGLFVEHNSNDEHTLRRDLELSLGALADGRPDPFDRPHTYVVGGACTDQPVCAFAVAIYGSEPWSWAT